MHPLKPLNNLGAVVAEYMQKAGVTADQASLNLGLDRATFDSRTLSGDFTDVEVQHLALLLHTTGSRLYALAERGAA